MRDAEVPLYGLQEITGRLSAQGERASRPHQKKSRGTSRKYMTVVTATIEAKATSTAQMSSARLH